MGASFEFINYEITEITYATRIPQDSQDDNCGTIENEIRLDRNNEDPSLFRLQLKVNVQEGKNICLKMQGFFKWNLAYVEKETENALVSFGTTMLYPYARTAISTISVLDGGTPIIIPTINPFHMNDEQTENNNLNSIPTEAASIN